MLSNASRVLHVTDAKRECIRMLLVVAAEEMISVSVETVYLIRVFPVNLAISFTVCVCIVVKYKYNFYNAVRVYLFPFIRYRPSRRSWSAARSHHQQNKANARNNNANTMRKYTSVTIVDRVAFARMRSASSKTTRNDPIKSASYHCTRLSVYPPNNVYRERIISHLFYRIVWTRHNNTSWYLISSCVCVCVIVYKTLLNC